MKNIEIFPMNFSIFTPEKKFSVYNVHIFVIKVTGLFPFLSVCQNKKKTNDHSISSFT